MAEAALGLYDQVLHRIQSNHAAVEKEVIPYSLNGGVLGNVECPICNNTGMITIRDGFNIKSRECQCMKVRRAKKRIKESGLCGIMEQYSLKNYKIVDPWTNWIKEKAKEYINADGGWFYVHGLPGSGKTHICTAICSELIEKGEAVRYVIWTDIVQQLRSVINDREYDGIMRDLKNADVLYIDDFLKGNISDADMKRAFEIINARYNLPTKKTIISSERSLEYVQQLDPAVAGRIKQRSKGFCIRTQDKDWRFQA